MPLITDANETWQSFTPTAAGIIQVKRGSIEFSQDAGATKAGVTVFAGDAVPTTTTAAIFYRRVQGEPAAEFTWTTL